MAFQNLSPQPIIPSFWTTLSSGVTVNSTTGDITIPSTGAAFLSARGAATTVAGKLYRFCWTMNNSAQIRIGTSNGGNQIKAGTSSEPAATYAYEFTATTTQTWFQFQRMNNGTVAISNIFLQEEAIGADTTTATADNSVLKADKG